MTVFDKPSSTPIFQLLDDIDEPGSISTVDISKDGSFVTAGGKAVHARQMGNGGEVYAIKILDQLSNDVGVKSITALGRLVNILHDGIFTPGVYHMSWHGDDALYRQLSAGVYFLQVEYEKTLITKKLIMVR